MQQQPALTETGSNVPSADCQRRVAVCYGNGKPPLTAACPCGGQSQDAGDLEMAGLSLEEGQEASGNKRRRKSASSVAVSGGVPGVRRLGYVISDPQIWMHHVGSA